MHGDLRPTKSKFASIYSISECERKFSPKRSVVGKLGISIAQRPGRLRAVVWKFLHPESAMSYQARLNLPRARHSSVSIEELLSDPSLTNGLIVDSVPELLTQIASRVASLKTLESTLRVLMFSQRGLQGGNRNGSNLLSASELSKVLSVPETWIREQARLGNLPSFKLGHYVRFRLEEIERFLTERATQAA